MLSNCNSLSSIQLHSDSYKLMATCIRSMFSINQLASIKPLTLCSCKIICCCQFFSVHLSKNARESLVEKEGVKDKSLQIVSHRVQNNYPRRRFIYRSIKRSKWTKTVRRITWKLCIIFSQIIYVAWVIAL